jgi:hypothetical protein
MIGQLMFERYGKKLTLDIDVEEGILTYFLHETGHEVSIRSHLSNIPLPTFHMDYHTNRDVVHAIKNKLEDSGCRVLVSITLNH